MTSLSQARVGEEMYSDSPPLKNSWDYDDEDLPKWFCAAVYNLLCWFSILMQAMLSVFLLTTSPQRSPENDRRRLIENDDRRT